MHRYAELKRLGQQWREIWSLPYACCSPSADYVRAALTADGLGQGLSGEDLDRHTASAFGRRVVEPVVTARLSQGDVTGARAFFDAHRDGMAGDARARAEKTQQRLQDIIDSPLGAAAYDVAYLSGASEADQDRALELGKAAGQIFGAVTGIAGGARNIRWASFGQSKPKVEAWVGQATSKNYRAAFLKARPELDGNVVVHHAIEQQVLKAFPGVFTQSEIHSLENLRGIPNALNSTLHLRTIRAEWDNFYEPYLDSGTKPTKEELLQKATEIDRKYGHQFAPRLGEGN